jgi:glyoxylase-like metal-dependent hydrolase (beta-lactamase superfamily II)
MTLEGTNSYLVGREPCWLIDPGPDDDGHVEALGAEAERRGGLAAVVLTHGHRDHAAAAERFDAPVLRPTNGEAVGPLTALATPGHAPDHVCLVSGPVCYCGELLLGHGSSFVPPREHGGSLAEYLASLERLAACDLDVLHPGHGPPIDDPAAKITAYLEHRRMRERLLLAALESGERSRARLLDIAWEDVPAELRSAAAVVMEAHLEKLGDEGRLPVDLAD